MISSAIIPQPLARLPWRLIFLVLGIGFFGLVNLYSAAGGRIEPWALRQGLAFAFFLAVAISISKVREGFIKQVTAPVFVTIVIMLILVDLLGFVGKGAQRWLDLGIIRLQPSEFMKPAVGLMVARFYELLPMGEIRKFRAIWPAALLIAVPAVLVILQPDLGTGLMICFAGITVMFLAGVPLRWFLIPGLTVAAAIPVIYQFLLHGYQKRRVDTFLNPENDPLGSGYHITQSKIAIGSGGLFGKGYLQGSQSHLQYLPEGHTDFAFAALVEEWGMLGGTVVIVAWLMVLRWSLKVAANAPTRFGRLSCAGLNAVLFSYFAINLLMVMGLAPVVGIPLPMISYGGSAVMTVMICLGLLMSFERQQRSQSTLS
ncbi:rod shape-determining protein RodA [Sphingomonas sp. LHG3406-1]|uniref:rod shape-determining protein RodA n=1 Tax=Sphingomonas sp. LHG3406-1 TaxID=2804617 RepID=UPI00262DAC54|nr:rod shape-determining protein RodA [Sphingomonas sp. LHG3406-1]